MQQDAVANPLAQYFFDGSVDSRKPLKLSKGNLFVRSDEGDDVHVSKKSSQYGVGEQGLSAYLQGKSQHKDFERDPLFHPKGKLL